MRIFVVLLFFHFSDIALAMQLHKTAEVKNDPPGKVLYYPNCRITIFSSQPDSWTTPAYKAESNSLSQEQMEKTFKIMEQVFNPMPERFRMEFDRMHIYLVNSLDEHIISQHSNQEFSFRSKNREIFLAINHIRPGLDQKGSIEISLISELGYLISEKYMAQGEMSSVIASLSRYRMNFRAKSTTGKYTSTYQSGFVNYLCLNNNFLSYNPHIEFGEIFAYMNCQETKAELMDYVTTHPTSDLARKVEMVQSVIEHLIPESVNIPTETFTDDSITQEPLQSELLASHELRSFQTNMADITTDNNEIETNYHHESTEFVSLHNEFLPTMENRDDRYSSQQVLIGTEENRNKEGYSTLSSTTVKKKHRKGGWIVLGIVLLSLAIAGN